MACTSCDVWAEFGDGGDGYCCVIGVVGESEV